MLYKTSDGKIIEILRKNYRDDVSYYNAIIQTKQTKQK